MMLSSVIHLKYDYLVEWLLNLPKFEQSSQTFMVSGTLSNTKGLSGNSIVNNKLVKTHFLVTNLGIT